MTSFFLAFFGGVLGTILGIIFGYVDFSDFSDYGWKSALRPMFIWPWISFPVVFTLFNMALPFVVMTLVPNTTHQQMAGGSIVYSFLITTLIAVPLAYPGNEELELWMLDGHFGALTTVMFCTFMIQFFVILFSFLGIEEWRASKGVYRPPSRLRKILKRCDENDRGPTYREFPVSERWAFGTDVVVGAGLGQVKFESNRQRSSETLQIYGDLRVGKDSSVWTTHGIIVAGNLEFRGGKLSSDHAIMLGRGGYILAGDLEARHLISFGELSIDGDLIVSGSVICEGEISCAGRISVGGVIEAFAVKTSDPDRLRRENTLEGGTRVEALDE